MSSFKQLTQSQRYQIEILNKENISVTRIAHLIGVHKSTVSRELKRNSLSKTYSAETANKLYLKRKNYSKKKGISESTKLFVTYALSKKWSPEQISGIGERLGFEVSHQWIYNFISLDKKSGGQLYKHLRRAKRKYTQAHLRKYGKVRDATSIEKRPPVVDEKTRFGDWEADLVMGKRGTGAIVTIAERKSRFYLIKKVHSKDSLVVAKAMILMLSPYKEFCHTITFDNGLEFSEHLRIAKELEAETFFAHPYSSYERGLNENQNGLLRQFIPKGTDLRTVSEAEIKLYETALNHRPRKCLNYETPYKVFMALFA